MATGDILVGMCVCVPETIGQWAAGSFLLSLYPQSFPTDPQRTPETPAEPRQRSGKAKTLSPKTQGVFTRTLFFSQAQNTPNTSAFLSGPGQKVKGCSLLENVVVIR